MINQRERRPVIGSELFRGVTTASPAEVWAALTATGAPLGFMHGLTAESDWRPGATLTLTLDRWSLVGEVLVADAPGRLSYTLGDRPEEPSVYVTWELRAFDGGTIVRLTVDEPWPIAGTAEALETAWLPVLSGLVGQLGLSPGGAGHEQNG